MRTIKILEVNEFDDLVSDHYNRPYSFQQQDDCKDRATYYFKLPLEHKPEDYENDTVPEKVNDPKMGVSFKAWLARDPNQLLSSEKDNNDWSLSMWWERNFYPHFDILINDLHEKGILEAGEYGINIDW